MFGIPTVWWIVIAVVVIVVGMVRAVKNAQHTNAPIAHPAVPTVPDEVVSPTEDKEEESGSDIYDEGDINLSDADMKPMCPHCKAEMPSIHWITTDFPSGDVLYLCSVCRAILSIMERP